MALYRESEPVIIVTPVDLVDYAEGHEPVIEAVAKEYIQRFNLDSERKRFSAHIVEATPDGRQRVIHVDDLTAISHIEKFKNVATYCSRAFTRAREGDFVLATLPVIPGYRRYMEKRLKLGNPVYIRLKSEGLPYLWSLFEALKRDEESQEKIVDLLLKNQRLVIHPYFSTFGAWEMAELLSEKTDYPVKVLAPLPTVARIANHKNHFLSICRAVCGEAHCLTWKAAHTAKEVCRLLVEMAQEFDEVVFRYPDSATGMATEILKSGEVQQKEGDQLEAFVKEWLQYYAWDENNPKELQVSGWEPDVLASPSAQLWLPPESEGMPVVEEILDQLFLEEDPKVFNGSRISQLPGEIVEEVKRLAYMVGRTFQKMGYVGRCSFDLLVCGESIEKNWTVKFVECNGRWGGGSTPMTLMNRLFGDHRNQPYLHRVISHPLLVGVSFPQFLELFDDVLYNPATDEGWAIVYNLALLEAEGQLDLIAIGDTIEQAQKRHESFYRIIEEYVGNHNE